MLDHAAKRVGAAVQQASAARLKLLDALEEHHKVKHHDLSRDDLSNGALGDFLVDDAVCGQKGRPQRLTEEKSFFLCQRDQLGTLRIVDREGFFADHIFAALQRLAAERVMRVVRHGDIDDVHVSVCKQLFRSAVGLFKAELFREGLRLFQMGSRAGIETYVLIAELIEDARHPGGDGADAAKTDIHSLFLSL